MAKSDIGAIVNMIKEGLSLWKTFIATRQEAYNRHRDKLQVKAIEAAEKLIFQADTIIATLKVKYPSAKEDKDLQGTIKSLERYRKHFFKYH